MLRSETQPQISIIGNSHPYPSIIFDADISSLQGAQCTAGFTMLYHALPSPPIEYEDGMDNTITMLRAKHSV